MTLFEDRPRTRTRRRLLGTIGAGIPIGLAGCLGGGNDGDDTADGEDGANDVDGEDGANDVDGEDGANDVDGENRYADHLIEHPGDEPLAFTQGQICPVCRMTPANYQHWHCQLAHENGEGAAFDTPGCLFAYYAFQPVEAPVTAGWVMGIETRDLIDATDAYYVLVTDDAATRDDPMGPNPRPFAERDDAVAYLEEWDAEDLTEDDIVQLADVDRDVAALYRESRFP